MVLTKAGECLCYGIGNEFWDKDQNPKNHHLKAFILYFTLKGYIDRKNMKIIKDLLLIDDDICSLQEGIQEDIIKILVHNLKSHIQFKDTNDLFAVLNKEVIPIWAFISTDELWELLPDLFMIDDLFYYIINISGRFYFRCIHTGKCDEITEFNHDYSSDFDTDMVSCEEINHTISNSYSEIMAYDEVKRVFLLRMCHNSSMYAEYYVDTKQEVIHQNRCVGIIGRKIPVIEEGNNLSAVIGRKSKKIKEVSRLEEYSVIDNYIIVKPNSCMPVMFKPYKLTLDGEKVDYPYAENARFMLNKIVEDIWSFSRIAFSSEIKRMDMTVFSLDFLDKFLNERYKFEESQEARMYHFLIKILEHYLDKKADVLDYFYMFSDISKRLEKMENYKTISEDFYWRINELHISGRLRPVIENINRLKVTLLEGVYWDEVNLMEKLEYKSKMGLIGSFSFKRTKLRAHTYDLKSAVSIGNQMAIMQDNVEGLVSYNLETGVYEIQYYRMFTKAEISAVLSAFHIADVAHRIIITEKN